MINRTIIVGCQNGQRDPIKTIKLSILDLKLVLRWFIRTHEICIDPIRTSLRRQYLKHCQRNRFLNDSCFFNIYQHQSLFLLTIKSCAYLHESFDLLEQNMHVWKHIISKIHVEIKETFSHA
jgi:hypothetical protein